MAEVNPFEMQQQPPPAQWGGLTQLVPQEQLVQPEGGWMGGLDPMVGGSYHAMSPEVMSMLWQPQQEQQVLPPAPPPVF